MNLPSLHLIVLFGFLGRCFGLTGFTGRMSSLLGLLIQRRIFFPRNIFMDLSLKNSVFPAFWLYLSSINFMASRESSSEV